MGDRDMNEMPSWREALRTGEPLPEIAGGDSLGRIAVTAAGAVFLRPVQLGLAIGSLVGGLLFPSRRAQQSPQRISNLQLTVAEKGNPIPVHWGTQRLAGVLIWFGNFQRHESTTGGKGGGKGGGAPTMTDVRYSASYQIGICEGPASSISAIWAGKDRVWGTIQSGTITAGGLTTEARSVRQLVEGVDFRIYLGTASQTADPHVTAVFSTMPVDVQRESVTAPASGAVSLYRVTRPPILGTPTMYFMELVPGGDLRGESEIRVSYSFIATTPGANQAQNVGSGDLRIGWPVPQFGGTIATNLELEYSRTVALGANLNLAYRHTVYVTFMDQDLGPSASMPNHTFEVMKVVGSSAPVYSPCESVSAIVDPGATDYTFTALQHRGETIYFLKKQFSLGTFEMFRAPDRGVSPAFHQASNSDSYVRGLAYWENAWYSNVFEFSPGLSFATRRSTDDGLTWARTYLGAHKSAWYTFAGQSLYAIGDASGSGRKILYLADTGANWLPCSGGVQGRFWGNDYAMAIPGAANRAFCFESFADADSLSNIAVYEISGLVMSLVHSFGFGDNSMFPYKTNGERNWPLSQAAALMPHLWVAARDMGGTNPPQVHVTSDTGVSWQITTFSAWSVRGRPGGFAVYSHSGITDLYCTLAAHVGGVLGNAPPFRIYRLTLPGSVWVQVCEVTDANFTCYAAGGNGANPNSAGFMDYYMVLWNNLTDEWRTYRASITPGGISSLRLDVNPVDVLSDFLANDRYGPGLTLSHDEAQWIDVRSFCEENDILVSPIFAERQNALQHVEHNLTYFDGMMPYSQGLFRLKARRNEAATASLTPDDMATEAPMSPYGKMAHRETRNRLRLEWTYRHDDYNRATADAFDDTDLQRTGERQESVALNGVTRSVLAQKFVQRALWNRLYQPIMIHDWRSGPRKGAVEPGDVITVTHSEMDLSARRFRVLNISEEESRRFGIEMIDEPTSILGYPGQFLPQQPAQTDPSPPRQSEVVDTLGLVFEAPAEIPTAFSETPVLGLAVSGVSTLWAGTDVHVSRDGDSYQMVTAIRRRSTFGFTTSAMPEVPTAGLYDDEDGQVTVDFAPSFGSVTAVSREDMLALTRLSMVGDELVSFQDVTLVGSYRYALRGMRRGVYNTSVASKAIGTSFVLLFGGNVRYIPLTRDDVGRTLFVKLPSVNIFGAVQDLASVVALQVTPTGRTLQPDPPSGLAVEGLYVADVTNQQSLKFVWRYAYETNVEDIEINSGIVPDSKEAGFTAYVMRLYTATASAGPWTIGTTALVNTEAYTWVQSGTPTFMRADLVTRVDDIYESPIHRRVIQVVP